MNFWRALRTLHIHLSLASLVLLGFFAVTGVLLVHANDWGLDVVTERTAAATMPPAIVGGDRLAIVEFLRDQGCVGGVTDYAAEPDELRVVFERPGQRCEANVHLPDGTCELSFQSRGRTALLLDLHTGKAAGAWWFAIDLAGLLWVLVTLTGFALWLQLKKRHRVGMLWLAIGGAASVVGYALLTP